MIENEKNLPTKTRRLKYIMTQMRLDHAATRHRNHEARCTTVFSHIVKRLAT